DTRMAVVRRRLDYEADPAGFAARYAAADRDVAERILRARDRLAQIALDDAELRRIAALCACFDVDGMRADLVVARTATAHAAWRGADAVEEQDVRVAAELALPHRRRRDPFDEPGISEEQLEQAMREAAEAVDQARPPAPEPDSPPGPPENRDGDSGDDGPGDDSPGEDPPGEDPHDGDSTGGEPDPDDDPDGTGPGGRGAGNSGAGRSGTPASGAARPPRWEVPGVGEGAPGRRSRAQTRNGRVVRATTGPGTGLHLLGTVFAAAPRQHLRERAGGGIVLAPEDLRGAYREGREGNLVVFVVDASGSMAARDRLSAVTGAVV